MTTMQLPIYHITHIENLESIICEGRLLAYNSMRREEIQYTNIAENKIQSYRATVNIPWNANRRLHDYVPFYFAPRSPMLYSINKDNVPSYTQGQKPVIHLVFDVFDIDNRGLDFVFTDGHPVIQITNFFDDLRALEYLDWDVMEARYWNDTEEDNDRKRRRQAEFLVYNLCPWELIAEIGVINSTIQAQVENILQKFTDKTPVKVRGDWYY